MVAILNELLALTGYHRKHAIRLFRAKVASKEKRSYDRFYGETVRQALTVLWEMRPWSRKTLITPPGIYR